VQLGLLKHAYYEKKEYALINMHIGGDRAKIIAAASEIERQMRVTPSALNSQHLQGPRPRISKTRRRPKFFASLVQNVSNIQNRKYLYLKRRII
jgi:hypothetical protein